MWTHEYPASRHNTRSSCALSWRQPMLNMQPCHSSKAMRKPATSAAQITAVCNFAQTAAECLRKNTLAARDWLKMASAV